MIVAVRLQVVKTLGSHLTAGAARLMEAKDPWAQGGPMTSEMNPTEISYPTFPPRSTQIRYLPTV